MGKTKLCAFGQECEKAVGYDDQHAEIILGSNKTVSKKNVEVGVKSLCLSRSDDYKQMCSLLDITPKHLLKTFANRKTAIDKIWECVFDIRKFPCFCINIYLLNDSTSVAPQKSQNNQTKQIKKFYSGHHVVIFIPVEKTITESLDVNITQIIQGNRNVSVSCFDKKATVLINYQEKLECDSVYYFLVDLLNIVETKQSIYCLMSVSLPLEIIKGDNEETILTILSIKKVLQIIEQKVSDIKNITGVCDKCLKIVERVKLSAEIIQEVSKLQDCVKETMPVFNINDIYSMLRLYLDCFLKEIYESLSLSHGNSTLYQKLNHAWSDLLMSPFIKTSRYWILRMNDANEYEMKDLLRKKYWIILNGITMNYLEQLYGDVYNYYFVISDAEKEKCYQEPVLQCPFKEKYTIGISTYNVDSTEMKDAANEALFLATCECDTTEEKKVWMCIVCKTFLYVVKQDNEWLQCTCGMYNTAAVSKTCFKCLTQDEMKTLKQPIDQDAIKNTDSPNINAKNVSENEHHGSPPDKPNIQELPLPDSRNIIFVGQTGAGKSTLINSMANYIKYDFDAACNQYMEYCLPINFQMQGPDFEKIIISAGPENVNERFNDGGESVTQKPQIYKISAGNEKINIIDTPGLGDSRGAKQDLLNIEYIKEAIVECGKIDAICFVMQSDISKLAVNFEVLMRDLLALFPKTALKNVFFFFTYANSSFFAIGNTRKPLEEFITNFKATNNAEIKFGPENVFMVDSEAFMYFVATEQNYVYQNRDRESFRMSWDKSKAAINNFLTKIKSIEPVQSRDIEMNFELEKCIKQLVKDQPLSYELDNIQNLMALAYSATSVSSFSIGPYKRFSDEELIKSVKAAVEYCETLKDDNKKIQKIEKILRHYYKISFKNNDVNDTNATTLLMNEDVKTKFTELCKSLEGFRIHEENNTLTDIVLKAFLDIYGAVFSEKVSINLQRSLNILQNYLKENQKLELEHKLESILSSLATSS